MSCQQLLTDVITSSRAYQCPCISITCSACGSTTKTANHWIQGLL